MLFRSVVELVATALAVALLSGGLLSDLREREVDVLPLFAGAAIAALLPLLFTGSISALAGALAGLLLSTGLYATGRLYARARGLGTCWTTLHLTYEREVAEILGIPYADVTQSCLLTTGYFTGETFKPAPRGDISGLVHWDRW